MNLTIADDIPDSRSVSRFKEQLVDLKLIEPIFIIFLMQLESLGMILNEGKINDNSFIEVSRQRNTKDGNKQINEGELPEGNTKKPHKKAQKGLDARRTKKGGVNYFDYKNHVKVHSKSKIITKYIVTTANVHDSQPLENILPKRIKTNHCMKIVPIRVNHTMLLSQKMTQKTELTPWGIKIDR